MKTDDKVLVAVEVVLVGKLFEGAEKRSLSFQQALAQAVREFVEAHQEEDSELRDRLRLAKHRARAIFYRWNDVTGCVSTASGWYYELQGVIEDAVECGIQAAYGIHEELDCERHSRECGDGREEGFDLKRMCHRAECRYNCFSFAGEPGCMLEHISITEEGCCSTFKNTRRI